MATRWWPGLLGILAAIALQVACTAASRPQTDTNATTITPLAPTPATSSVPSVATSAASQTAGVPTRPPPTLSPPHLTSVPVPPTATQRTTAVTAAPTPTLTAVLLTAVALPPTPTPKRAPPSPTLTPLILQATAIPGQLPAEIHWPRYSPAARTSLWFRVTARDPQVGKADGAGIKAVEFHFLDANENEVYSRTEQTAAYCAFGGDDPNCPAWVFGEHQNKWPNGKSIQNGKYHLNVVVQPKKGDSQSGDVFFEISR